MVKDVERIVTDMFELSWNVGEGEEPLKRWEVAYLSAVVCSAFKDIRENLIPRDVRRVFERLSSVVDSHEVVEQGVEE